MFGGYLLAAAVYITVGALKVDFLLSVWVAVAYLLATAWFLPRVVRRLRRTGAA